MQVKVLLASGAKDENGNPAPTGAVCTSGNKCSNPGDSCGLFPYKQQCTDKWNSVTGECKCVCETY